MPRDDRFPPIRDKGRDSPRKRKDARKAWRYDAVEATDMVRDSFARHTLAGEATPVTAGIRT